MGQGQCNQCHAKFQWCQHDVSCKFLVLSIDRCKKNRLYCEMTPVKMWPPQNHPAKPPRNLRTATQFVVVILRVIWHSAFWGKATGGASFLQKEVIHLYKHEVWNFVRGFEVPQGYTWTSISYRNILQNRSTAKSPSQACQCERIAKIMVCFPDAYGFGTSGGLRRWIRTQKNSNLNADGWD